MVSIVTKDNLGTDFEIGSEVPNKINVKPATDTEQGKLRFATDAEVSAGATVLAAVTPVQVGAAVAAIVVPQFIPSATQPATAGLNPGDRWHNTSTATVAGVPADSVATWDGAGWLVDTNTNATVIVPQFIPSTTQPMAASLNPGDRWHNTSTATVAGVPADSVATWDGAGWLVDTNTNATVIVPQFIPSTTQPAAGGLNPGDRWHNTSTATVAGVPADSVATWDGAGWLTDTNVSAPTPTVVTQVFTTSGTFAKPAGLRWLSVTVTGGGGGGGGSNGVAGSAGGGTGGSAGNTVKKWFDAASVAVNTTVNVGAGGAGGLAASTTAANGSVGGNSTFGALVAGGGRGGVRVAPATTLAIVEGAVPPAAPTTGDVKLLGGHGGRLLRLSATEVSSGEGGTSFWGAGGRAVAGSAAGVAGQVPGSGGSGATVINATGQAGGAGAGGIVIVEMFF